jgi:hypothetical protein
MVRLLPFGGYVRFVLPVLVLGAVLIGPTGASAGPGISTTMPVLFGGTNPCTGEAFSGTGNQHFLITDNLSSSGMVQFHIEATMSGLQAVTTSDKKYVVVSQENQTNTFDSTDVGPAHETVEHTVQFVRSGEDGTLLWGDDFYEHFLAHITANANGVVTVQDVTTETRCR